MTDKFADKVHELAERFAENYGAKDKFGVKTIFLHGYASRDAEVEALKREIDRLKDELSFIACDIREGRY